jgi:hypothetical protein
MCVFVGVRAGCLYVCAYVCVWLRRRFGVCVGVGACSLTYSECKAHAPSYIVVCGIFVSAIFFDSIW